MKIPLPGQSFNVLDIGCGQGDFAADFIKAHPTATYLGIEQSQTAIQIAKNKVPSAIFLEENITDKFSVPAAYQHWATHAVCSEVLEHVENPGVLLENIKPFLASGCQVILTVPGGPMSAFDHLLGHRQHFKLRELRTLVERAGFNVMKLYGAGFPFFNLYRLIVISRGEKLATEVATEKDQSISWVAKAGMRLFSFLLCFNVNRLPWGWQRVGVVEWKKSEK